MLTCGGLSIRLPPLDAPATALENRHHCLRLAAMRGRLVGAPSRRRASDEALARWFGFHPAAGMLEAGVSLSAL